MSIDTGKPARADAAIKEVLHIPGVRIQEEDPNVATVRDQEMMRQMLLQERQEFLRTERAAQIVGRSLCAAGCLAIAFSASTGPAATIGLATVVMLVVYYWRVQQRWTRLQIRVLEKWLLSQTPAADTFIRWKWEANSTEANTASLLLRLEPFVWMSLTCVITIISGFGITGFIK